MGGHPVAFPDLFRKHQRMVYQFLLVRTACPADAEELTQETFLRAWRHRNTFDPRFRWSTWVLTIARRLAVNRLRGRRPECPEEDLEQLVGPASEPAQLLVDQEQKDNLWALAARVLKPEQRSALWLRYSEDLSIEEIAPILGKRPGAIRVLLHRARQTLARHWHAAEQEVSDVR